MKRTWKNFRIDKNKVYMRIGQVTVFLMFWVLSVAGTIFMFLQGMTY